MLKGFIILLSFFTRIPVANLVEYDEEKLKKSIYLYSLMGAIIGGILYVIAMLLKNVDQKIFVGLILTISYIIITGGIHLDGYSDSIDGLYSGREKKRILEIMKDSRVGAFGVIGLIILILSYVICFSSVPYSVVFMTPIVGRLSVVVSCYRKKYARESQGMGTFFVEGMSIKVLLVNLVLSLSFIFLFQEKIKLAITVLLTIILSRLISKTIENKIDGMTGDTCGFITEICQLIFLSIYIII